MSSTTPNTSGVHRRPPLEGLLARLRRRVAAETGFTMIIAMGVLFVTSLILTATFVALDGGTHLTQSDLNGKRAYYAAQAGVNAYLYQLNQNSNYWSTCTNDTTSGWVAVPGNTSGEQYEYSAVPANGNTSCNTNNIVGSMIDASSGELTMQFSGQAGSGDLSRTRTIIASFKRKSPLDYVWYTVYESDDSSISGYSDCAIFYRSGRNDYCNINWITGDTVNGPMYTQDQLYIGAGQSPVFGRDSTDVIATEADNSVCANGCGSAVFNGAQQTNVDVPEPTSNAALLTDAQNHGKVFTGTTSIQLSGSNAVVTNCPSSCTTTTVPLATYPIIYVQNGSGCTPATYTPFGPGDPTTGCTGDVYVYGNYTSSLTIAAANNIIVTNNITTTGSGTTLTGNAALGLIANQFVRVEHNVASRQSCSSTTNSYAISNLTIDASILSLAHSFIVDNYDCGPTMGTLTVVGAIVQKFRGAVGTLGNNGQPATGYLKSYNYDDRLASLTPPYLYDILTSGWRMVRQNLCSASETSNTNTEC